MLWYCRRSRLPLWKTLVKLAVGNWKPDILKRIFAAETALTDHLASICATADMDSATFGPVPVWERYNKNWEITFEEITLGRYCYRSSNLPLNTYLYFLFISQGTECLNVLQHFMTHSINYPVVWTNCTDHVPIGSFGSTSKHGMIIEKDKNDIHLGGFVNCLVINTFASTDCIRAT